MLPEHFLLEGIIVPDERDEGGEVKSLCLSTNSEQLFSIVMDKTGRELLGCLRVLVRVKAKRAGKGQKIRALSYKKIGEYSL